MKRKLYITLLGLLSTIMMAAVPYCDVRKFSITDGLAANTISDLKQGKDNLMWFSTWNGLSFYDGYKFHTFRDNPDDIDVLSTNRILKIEPSYNNNVWCITYDTSSTYTIPTSAGSLLLDRNSTNCSTSTCA